MTERTTEVAFRATGVHKAFRRSPVLRGLDLEVEPGSCTVLLGRNGTGKSTLMRLALGVLRPSAGQFCVAGLDPARQPDAMRQRVGYVPDRPDAPRWMTVARLFEFAAAHYPTWNRATARELTDQFDVPTDTRLGDMSLGQSMKAMMALALAAEPRVLLLDEPFAGLDPVVREDVLRAVIGALRDGERTVLCATHELDIAARIADRVAVLEDGLIATHGALAEVLGERDEGMDTAAAPQGLQRVMAAHARGRVSC